MTQPTASSQSAPQEVPQSLSLVGTCDICGNVTAVDLDGSPASEKNMQKPERTVRRVSREQALEAWESAKRCDHRAFLDAAREEVERLREANASYHASAKAQSGLIQYLRDQLAASEAECQEQAKLNGKGSEREAALLGKLAQHQAWGERAREVMRVAYAGLDGHPAWDDVRNNLKSVYSTHPAATNLTEEGK